MEINDMQHFVKAVIHVFDEYIHVFHEEYMCASSEQGIERIIAINNARVFTNKASRGL
jgi:hypothetical protein